MNLHSPALNGPNYLRFLIISLMFVFAGRAVYAEETTQPKIPAVDEKAPDFTLQDLDGRPVTLSKLAADSPVVLVVLRGYPGYQCPICSAQVGNLMSRSKEFADAGAKIVFVYPGPAEKLRDRALDFLGAKSVPGHFIMVTDPDYKFTQAYGLRWDAPRETAYPSTFVIDRQGTIRFAKVSRKHGDRANASEILQALSSAK